ncbi:hypothetical protein THAOC_12732 [Thalassiosira oceanica]|uniref:Uncharacterized protein n=1 Tax=Thalassiosira oceanica TaxID=159749 RepID=K0SZ86_THAOC|nr:hypothetical protein THAOC_12732 [Thalassiosira oceanica]|eukprot:EJK66356.1 hypothetical protein THAOC_12732 [Thalassiosira oceanica]
MAGRVRAAHQQCRGEPTGLRPRSSSGIHGPVRQADEKRRRSLRQIEDRPRHEVEGHLHEDLNLLRPRSLQEFILGLEVEMACDFLQCAYGEERTMDGRGWPWTSTRPPCANMGGKKRGRRWVRRGLSCDGLRRDFELKTRHSSIPH